MQIQALLTAATINVKRLLRLHLVPQAGLAVRLAGQIAKSVLVLARSGSVDLAHSVGGANRAPYPDFDQIR